MGKGKVLEVAENELGYIEKATNSNLDSKTANAGSNNYTKYGRDLVKWIAVRLSCIRPDGTPLWPEYWEIQALEDKKKTI